MVDYCISCGKEVPEGRLVCASCEMKSKQDKHGRKEQNKKDSGKIKTAFLRLFGSGK